METSFRSIQKLQNEYGNNANLQWVTEICVLYEGEVKVLFTHLSDNWTIQV